MERLRPRLGLFRAETQPSPSRIRLFGYFQRVIHFNA